MTVTALDAAIKDAELHRGRAVRLKYERDIAIAAIAFAEQDNKALQEEVERLNQVIEGLRVWMEA